MYKSSTAIKPIVSVVIPVYNVEKYLAKCIESVQNQTLENIEIVLVDDGSTDKSGAICDEYALKDERIVVIHQRNGGLAHARNTGIELARGEYIGFIDSDDWIDITMYEELVNEFAKKDIDVVCSGIKLVGSTGDIKEIEYVKENVILKGEEISRLLLKRKFSVSCCNKLFKRNLFKDRHFTVGKTNEDFELLFYLFLQVKQVGILANSYYYYRKNETSITSGIKNVKIFDLYYNACECLEYVQKFKKELKNEAFNYMIYQARFFLIRLLNEGKTKEFKQQYNDILRMMKRLWFSILFKSDFPLKEKIYFLYIIRKNKYEE